MYKIVSLFSGCGGSDLGLLGNFVYLHKKYKANSTEIVYALDKDAKAVETYNHNFKHKAVVEDVKNANYEDIAKCDILVGGFPCQSYSTVNPTKDPFDERGMLYKDMAEAIEKLNPKVIIAENVKGMVTLKNGAILQNVIKAFESKGYKSFYKILNSANFGVPQKRERVFIISFRNDLKIPNQSAIFPKELHNAESWVGIEKVLLPTKEVDKKYYFSEKAVAGMKNAKNNMKRGLAQNLNEPSLTITAHLAKASLNSRDPVLLVDKEKEVYRRFTPLEAARIQSFPDSFEFIGSDLAKYKQIGNAIPPVLMWYVTQSIVDVLNAN